MPAPLARTYKQARLVSLAGFVISTLCMLAAALICVVGILAFQEEGFEIEQRMFYWLNSLFSNIIFLLFTVLVSSFLWHFWRGRDPLGESQTRRLFASATCLFANVLSTMLDRSDRHISVASGPVPVGYSNRPGPHVSVTVVECLILLLCIVFILRYAKALKEDCESVV